jgi:plasmid stabilization system protein ParE
MTPVVSARARLDVTIILSISGERFGREAQRRYRLLIQQAITDIADDPRRPGSLAWTRPPACFSIIPGTRGREFRRGDVSLGPGM